MTTPNNKDTLKAVVARIEERCAKRMGDLKNHERCMHATHPESELECEVNRRGGEWTKADIIRFIELRYPSVVRAAAQNHDRKEMGSYWLNKGILSGMRSVLRRLDVEAEQKLVETFRGRD